MNKILFIFHTFSSLSSISLSLNFYNNTMKRPVENTFCETKDLERCSCKKHRKAENCKFLRNVPTIKLKKVSEGGRMFDVWSSIKQDYTCFCIALFLFFLRKHFNIMFLQETEMKLRFLLFESCLQSHCLS